ncbi:putative oxidoreductase ucpA [Tricladium varicosporioides]|nr:putative oxidoreductase ucpA [Hymenoscyphus varicosporioides]
MSSPPPHWGYNFTKNLHNDIYPSIDPTKTDLSQPFKVVLITGAGRGIGRSIALKYAESGVACIIICARTASELDEVENSIKKLSSTVKVRKCSIDIADESQVLATAEAVKRDEGRLDILINNAGVSAPWVPITESKPEEYWHTWTVHIKGTYLMLHAFLPLMVATAKVSGTVEVVNVTSIGAHTVFKGASAYQTSKFALLRLGEFIEAEYASENVNCFSVHPGGVLTEMSKNIEMIKQNLIDTPELCGGFVVWLTAGSRRWLNGRYLSATWNVDELEARKGEIIEGDKLKVRMVV